MDSEAKPVIWIGASRPFGNVIYVLHGFQKKSKKGIATPQKEIELIRQRLAAAQQHYKGRQN